MVQTSAKVSPLILRKLIDQGMMHCFCQAIHHHFNCRRHWLTIKIIAFPILPMYNRTDYLNCSQSSGVFYNTTSKSSEYRNVYDLFSLAILWYYHIDMSFIWIYVILVKRVATDLSTTYDTAADNDRVYPETLDITKKWLLEVDKHLIPHWKNLDGKHYTPVSESGSSVMSL